METDVARDFLQSFRNKNNVVDLLHIGLGLQRSKLLVSRDPPSAPRNLQICGLWLIVKDVLVLFCFEQSRVGPHLLCLCVQRVGSGGNGAFSFRANPNSWRIKNK